MKNRLVIIVSLICLAGQIWAFDNQETIYSFANKARSKVLLGQKDIYTNHFGKFDLQSKTQNTQGNLTDYLTCAQKQVKKWRKKEIRRVNSVLDFFDERIAALNLDINLPKEVLFLKTTMKEEGGASGYTRANYIVLNKKEVKKADDNLEHLVIHELFHVLSRYDHELREKLYRIIGFEYCNEIEMPQVLKDRYITNPDAPSYDAFIELHQGEYIFDAVMMIYSNRDYNGGSFFDYLSIGFVELFGEKDNKQVALQNGEPIIRGLNEVEGFFEQVGQNTQYIIDPEEIMADNFTFMIQEAKDLKNPEIVEEIVEVLRK